jgi:hypothetical protein
VPASESRTPTPLPLPRSLADHGAIRRELVALYRQAKAGSIDPPLLGRLVHLLSILAGLIRDTDIEQRLARLEAIAPPEPPWPGEKSHGAVIN